DRILEVVVAQPFDALAERDRLLGRPDTVRIEPEAILGEGLRQRVVAGQLVLRLEYAALELVDPEAVRLAQRGRLRDELLHRSYLSRPVRVGIPEEEVGGERHPVPQPAAQNIV